MIVGGLNYGMGSSRPAARSLRNCGIRALVADSINGLFFRNAVNFGLVALECPGVRAAFTEGQTAEVALEDFTVAATAGDRRGVEGLAGPRRDALGHDARRRGCTPHLGARSDWIAPR